MDTSATECAFTSLSPWTTYVGRVWMSNHAFEGPHENVTFTTPEYCMNVEYNYKFIHRIVFNVF